MKLRRSTKPIRDRGSKPAAVQQELKLGPADSTQAAIDKHGWKFGKGKILREIADKMKLPVIELQLEGPPVVHPYEPEPQVKMTIRDRYDYPEGWVAGHVADRLTAAHDALAGGALLFGPEDMELHSGWDAIYFKLPRGRTILGLLNRVQDALRVIWTNGLIPEYSAFFEDVDTQKLKRTIGPVSKIEADDEGAYATPRKTSLEGMMRAIDNALVDDKNPLGKDVELWLLVTFEEAQTSK